MEYNEKTQILMLDETDLTRESSDYPINKIEWYHIKDHLNINDENSVRNLINKAAYVIVCINREIKILKHRSPIHFNGKTIS